MCGLTGFWELKTRFTKENEHQVAEKMALSLKARGPDDKGTWVDENIGLAFGYRRLAIIDISPLGAQPMVSTSGNSVLVFNGEIYNFQEIRHDLESKGIRFKSHSDTEVLLEACEFYGVQKAVEKCLGMFAFALWRRDEQKLYLCRDRLGVKPLYWGFHNKVLFFGSQVNSFYAHPAFKPEINLEALGLYFKYNYVPSPLSILQDINKVEPGHILTIDGQGHVQETTYWSLDRALQRAQENPYTQSFEQACEDIETLLKDSVKKRMIADVPLGCFLSGGIDSSTVAALMQSQSPTPIKTFSIGFHEDFYNEAPHAKAIANHLGTDHTEWYCGPKDCLNLVPEICEWFDEPFADASQIPTYLVAKMARQHVTVALSGDGGDEVFAGYNRYQALSRYGWIFKTPMFLRKLGSTGLRGIPPSLLKAVEKSGVFQLAQLQEKTHKIGQLLDLNTIENLYDGLVSIWNHPSSLLKNFPHLPNSLPKVMGDPILYMQMQDMKTYLPDDILVKVDRTSMAVSLETREPLLDHRLLELSFRLPTSFKINKQTSKRPLRWIAHKHIPVELLERPKQGFSIPLDQWLRTGLNPWASDLLSKNQLDQDGILNSEFIHQQWADFKNHKSVNPHGLWGVLMFQSWYQRFKEMR
ncbi:MAG: asparagine synthase (glutamine-hydrolyzing) [Alphaproteobacteria bacterium]